MTPEEQRAYWREATAKYRAKHRERLRADALERMRKKREIDLEGVRARQREAAKKSYYRTKAKDYAGWLVRERERKRLARKRKLEAIANGLSEGSALT